MNIGGPRGEAWLYWPAPRRPAAARLFCFPHAGVGASVYRQWPHGLPVELEVCALQLPGRGHRLSEPPVATIRALVEAIVSAMAPQLDRPFAFFGHSMGAVLAFEVARALRLKGLPQPSRLIVSGRRGPHTPEPSPPLRHLSDAEFVAEINRRYGGIPAEILENDDVLALLLPCLRADIAALETHRPEPEPPLPCPISAFGGSDDPQTPRAQLDAWGAETTGGFEVRIFPGGHFYLEAQRPAVLAHVSAMLTPIFKTATNRELAK